MDKSYVFPKQERNRLIGGYISIICVFIVLETLFIYNYSGDFNFTFIIHNTILVIVFALILIPPIKYIKYRFSKYSIEHRSVSLFYKDRVRKISVDDQFNVSVMTMLYAGRYSNTPADFIVLWKEGTRIPVDDISPYVAMKKYDIIVLPKELEVMENLYTSLGINYIPTYPKVCLYGLTQINRRVNFNQINQGTIFDIMKNKRKRKTGDGPVSSDES